MANIIAVSNETNSDMVRMTRDGRKLTYRMKVLQQPQRARACGSGAKSSADRRPVDPPPVVELKILEGDNDTDITFSHNANFFLYTTLESARPIAQGRGSSSQAPFPVLTGMPVAGMAYLDRPSPAGYFIFPDLSVRHEGKYRLSFNLFEELKEDKDADAEPTFSGPDNSSNTLLRSSPMAPQAHVHFRLEVKSEPFVVYSAKKFPGLAESTQLSRVVAEQGCRVRIRRDVRMRRRDTKASKDYDDYDEEGAAHTRPERFATPDGYSQQAVPDRARSVSNASVEAHPPYATIERRPSVHEISYYNQSTHPQAPVAQLPQSASSAYSSHLSFGGPSTTVYQTPALPANNTSIHPPASGFVPATSGYVYQPTVQSRQMAPQQNYAYPPGQSFQYPSHAPPQPYGESTEYKPVADYRRPTNAPTYPGSHPTSTLTSESRNPPVHLSYYPQLTASNVPRAATPNSAQVLPPLKALQPNAQRKYEQPPTSSVPGSGPGSISSTWAEPGSSPYAYAAASQKSSEVAGRSAKRSFAAVFDTAHMNQPIHGGMRPSMANQGQDVSQLELDDGTLEDEDDMPNFKLLSYRRADGSRKHKKCPSPIS
ncbi:velvet protein [Xylographa opegraphella]|nr:velvet protein [Xylographa opegraphella]